MDVIKRDKKSLMTFKETPSKLTALANLENKKFLAVLDDKKKTFSVKLFACIFTSKLPQTPLKLPKSPSKLL
jgi:hypothetical protein